MYPNLSLQTIIFMNFELHPINQPPNPHHHDKDQETAETNLGATGTSTGKKNAKQSILNRQGEIQDTAECAQQEREILKGSSELDQ